MNKKFKTVFNHLLYNERDDNWRKKIENRMKKREKLKYFYKVKNAKNHSPKILEKLDEAIKQLEKEIYNDRKN